MYHVVGRIIKDGKAIGFRCVYRDNRSKTKEVNLSNKSIDRLILNGISIDIGKNKRGYYFKTKGKHVSDLQRYDISTLSKERNRLNDITGNKEAVESMIGIKGQQSRVTVKNIYTSQELEEYISTLSFQKEVSKIEKLKEFLNTPDLYYGNCFIVTGMKRSGKTVLVEQSIRYLLNKGVSSEEILLIQYRAIDERVDDEIDSLIEYLTESKCKYIFIDEITMLREFARRGRDFTDVLCKNKHRRIVLSGSDTIAFTLAETEYMMNRCFKISTTVLEYRDWYNILKDDRQLDTNNTLKLMFQFMGDCTLNKYSQYKDNKAMYSYLMDAISENIINSINKNTVYRSPEITESGLGNMDKENVLFIFYVVCYDVIHKAILEKLVCGKTESKRADDKLRRKGIRVKKEIGYLTKSISNKKIIKDNENNIINEVLNKLGISVEMLFMRPEVTDRQYLAMLGIMEEMNIIGRSSEYRSIELDTQRNNVEYMLQIPSIYSTFIKNIFIACEDYYNALAKEMKSVDLNDAYGLLFEAVIVTQIKEYLREYNRDIVDNVGKLRIDNNKEIDILMPGSSIWEVQGCLYDVKLSNKLNQRHFKAFDDEIKKKYNDIIEAGHAGIIYTGETVTLRNGLVAINAHDFLMDIGKYVN